MLNFYYMSRSSIQFTWFRWVISNTPCWILWLTGQVYNDSHLFFSEKVWEILATKTPTATEFKFLSTFTKKTSNKNTPSFFSKTFPTENLQHFWWRCLFQGYDLGFPGFRQVPRFQGSMDSSGSQVSLEVTLPKGAKWFLNSVNSCQFRV